MWFFIHARVAGLPRLARWGSRYGYGPIDAVSNLGASSLHGEDMDGDGDIDVALSRSGSLQSNYLAWHSNAGGGDFGALEILVQLPALVRETHVRDVDLDGLPDFILLQEDGQVIWYRNLGAPPGQTLDLGPAQTINAPTPFLRTMRAGDVDGDGDMDLVSLLPSGGTTLFPELHYAENLGTGAFAPIRVSQVTSHSTSSLDLTDMDGDGDLDAVMPSAAGNSINWHVNDGTGRFSGRVIIGFLADRPTSILASDLDRDGDIDVLAATFITGGGVHWFEALGGGTFASPVSLFPYKYIASDFNLGLADLSGDGVDDIWCNNITVQWIDGMAPSSQWIGQDLGPSGGFPGGTCLIDYDGDGDQDVAATDSDGLHIFVNDGHAGFYDKVHLQANFDSDSAPFAVDIDQDGDLDLVFGQGQYSNPQRVFAKENLGGGQFTPRRTLDTSTSLGDPRILPVDLEGDGDIDLLLSYPFGPSHWLQNDGTGTFLRLGAISDAVFGVAQADLDGDGAIEFLSVQSRQTAGVLTNCSVLAYEWSPSGTIANSRVLASFSGGCSDYQRVALGDVTSDGMLDVVVYNPDLATIDVLQGLGAGNFGAPLPLVAALAPPFGLEIMDVDTDGIPDLLGYSHTAAFWYRGLGNGTFAAGERYQQGSLFNGAGPLEVADLDGDGDDDLLKLARSPIIQLNTTRIGLRSCTDQDPNSSGAAGTLWSEGSTRLADNSLSLVASRLPTNQFGIFLVAPLTGLVPNPGGALGTLCLGGPIGRFNRPSEIRFTGPTGTAALPLDLARIPTPQGTEALAPGDTRFFQFWFRDTGPGSAANLTAALELQFR